MEQDYSELHGFSAVTPVKETLLAASLACQARFPDNS
jgi:hypothetical protein